MDTRSYRVVRIIMVGLKFLFFLQPLHGLGLWTLYEGVPGSISSRTNLRNDFFYIGFDQGVLSSAE